MEWVIRSFKYMKGIWEERATEMESKKPEHTAYAAREMDR
jgi:hypothetical protein